MATIEAKGAAIDTLIIADTTARVRGAAVDALVIGDSIACVEAVAIDVLVIAPEDCNVTGVAVDVLVIAVLPPPVATNDVTRGAFKQDTNFSIANVPPYGGSADHIAESDEVWVDGTVDRRMNQGTVVPLLLGPGAMQVVDLKTVLQQAGTALDLAELRALHITTPRGNPAGPITVEPDATDGWVSLWQVGSIVNLFSITVAPLELIGKSTIQKHDDVLR